MLDYIIFAENMYPARKVAIEGYGSELIISTEDLEAVLMNRYFSMFLKGLLWIAAMRKWLSLFIDI